MKRIRVPGGMLKAIQKPWFEYVANDSDHQKLILEAALLWLSEHPQVPTDKQAKELIKSSPYCDLEDWPKHHAWCIEQWQRRCFQEEEPEIPEEIKDLLCTDPCCTAHHKQFQDVILEAYRRGLTRGSVALRKGEQK